MHALRSIRVLRSIRALTLAALAFTCVPQSALAQSDADERYQYLVGLYDKELYELAAKEAQSFLAEHPRHAKAELARYRLASSLFELERNAEAAPHFRALSGDEDFEYAVECSLRLGQCELELERPAQAERAFGRVLASDKDYLHAPASFLAGEAAFQREDYAAAEARYGDSLKLEPKGDNAAHALRGQTWCDFKTGKNERAVARAKQFLGLHARHELSPEVRFVLGEAQLASGRPAEALAAFRGVRDGPFHDAALRGAGFAYAALGRNTEAAAAFGALREEFPGGRFAREATLQQGSHLLRAGDAKGALRVLTSPTAGDDAETLYWRARAQAETGAKEPALATLERALSKKPAPELAGRLRALSGDLAFDLGRLDEAARAYEQSGSDYALHAAAIAHLNAGRAEEAVRAARSLIEQHPRSEYLTSTRLTLGEAFFSLGRHEEALAAFAPVANGAGEADAAARARALSRVAWCKYLAGDPRSAAPLFERVTSQYTEAPEAEEARYMQGRAALDAGEDAQAARAFSAYLSEYPRGAHRDEVLLRLAGLESGTESLELLLADYPDSEHAERARYELARKHEAAGRRPEAIAGYRALLAAHPNGQTSAGARYALAWNLHEAGKPAQATKELELLLATRPDLELALPALELLVWTARDSGDTERCVSACRAFGEVCRDELRSYAVTEVTARALDADGKHDEAQRLLQPFVRDGAGREVCLRARVERAWCALHAKQLDAAEREVRAALRIAMELELSAPTVAEAAYFVGEAWYEDGAYARSAPHYAAAASLKGSKLVAEANYKRGFAALNADDPSTAAAAFGVVVRDQRESDLWGECVYLLGESFYRLGRYADTVEVLELLRREAPRHETLPKALFRLGLAAAETGDAAASESALSELVRKHPDFEQRAEAELARGRALVGLEKRRAARAAFSWVVASDKGLFAARARLDLGRMDLAAGKTEDALAQFLKVSLLFAHDEEVAEALYFAGRCLEAQGEPALARRQYEEVIEDHPRSPFAAEARERLKRL